MFRMMTLCAVLLLSLCALSLAQDDVVRGPFGFPRPLLTMMARANARAQAAASYGCSGPQQQYATYSDCSAPPEQVQLLPVASQPVSATQTQLVTTTEMRSVPYRVCENGVCKLLTRQVPVQVQRAVQVPAVSAKPKKPAPIDDLMEITPKKRGIVDYCHCSCPCESCYCGSESVGAIARPYRDPDEIPAGFVEAPQELIAYKDPDDVPMFDQPVLVAWLSY